MYITHLFPNKLYPHVATGGLHSKSAEDKGDSQGTPRKKIVEGFHSWSKFAFG
jgi:hypothetical protein